MSDQEEFETHDIYLAAFFTIAGCKMLRRRKQGNRLYFVFTNPAGSMKDMRESYYSGEAKVPAHQYAQQVIAFKQLCFE